MVAIILKFCYKTMLVDFHGIYRHIVTRFINIFLIIIYFMHVRIKMETAPSYATDLVLMNGTTCDFLSDVSKFAFTIFDDQIA